MMRIQFPEMGQNTFSFSAHSIKSDVDKKKRKKLEEEDECSCHLALRSPAAE